MRERRDLILLYVIGGIFLGFVLLSVLVYISPITNIDTAFSADIQKHQHPIIDMLMKLISWPGYAPQSIIIVISTAVLFQISKFKRESVFVTLTLVSGLVSSSIKLVVGRPRPTDDLVRIIEVAKHHSFPSGHVLFYVVFFGFMVILMNHRKDINKTLRTVVMGISSFLIFTVPVSRIYLGAHWFTDVLAGAMLGIVLLFSLSYFYVTHRHKNLHDEARE